MESLGEFLKQSREQSGVSVSELAEKTRIRVENIRALESEKLDELPNDLYVRGFVKVICRELEVSPDDGLLRYEVLKEGTGPRDVIEWKEEREVVTPGRVERALADPDRVVRNFRKGVRIAGVALSALGIALVLVFGWRFLSRQVSETDSGPAEEALVADAHRSRPEAVAPDPPPGREARGSTDAVTEPGRAAGSGNRPEPGERGSEAGPPPSGEESKAGDGKTPREAPPSRVEAKIGVPNEPRVAGPGEAKVAAPDETLAVQSASPSPAAGPDRPDAFAHAISEEERLVAFRPAPASGGDSRGESLARGSRPGEVEGDAVKRESSRDLAVVSPKEILPSGQPEPAARESAEPESHVTGDPPAEEPVVVPVPARRLPAVVGPRVASGERLVLEVEALRDVDLKVLLDGQGAPRSKTLAAGEKKRWKADRLFVLEATDAGAIRVSLQGDPLGPFGPDGEAASRTIRPRR